MSSDRQKEHHTISSQLAALVEYADGGHPVYGGSSGAIVLGKDIQTCAHKEANTVQLEDMRGLDLVRGYSLWCHYTPIDDVRIAAFSAKFALPVLALSERGGFGIAKSIIGQLSNVGNKSVTSQVTGNVHGNTVMKFSE